MTDNEILELINKRDEAALREIERQYSARCQNIAKEITGSDEAARECFFDAMISLWNGGNISAYGEGGQADTSGMVGEYLERTVRIAAEKRAGINAKTSADAPGRSALPPAASVFPVVSDISDISETGKTGNIIPGDPGLPDTAAGSAENGEKNASGTGVNADAAGNSGNSGISGTGKKKQRKLFVITGIIAAVVIAGVLIALAARMHRSAGDGKGNSHNSASPGNNSSSPRPTGDNYELFEYGVPIVSNDNVMLPEILSDYVKSYEPLVFSSTYMENKILRDTGDLNLTFWEAFQGVSYARENPCGGVLILDNYNFDPTQKIGFSFTTQMSVISRETPGSWTPIVFMAEYSGTSEIDTDGSQIIACKVDTIKPVPFDSINAFLELNPNLPDSILAFLKNMGIDGINSYIKDMFDTLSTAESEGDKFGDKYDNLYHSTQVLFKWNKEKTALRVFKNSWRSPSTVGEITYDYSGDFLKKVTVYKLDMSSIIYKASEMAIYEEPGGESEWSDSDPDEPDFYVHTFGADNCRTIYWFTDGRLSGIELKSGQQETKDSTPIATVTYTFRTGRTLSENRLVRTSHYGYKKVFLRFDPGGNICQREVFWHKDMIESLSISKGYLDPDGDLTYSEQFKLDDGSEIRRIYHTTGYKDKVLVLESERIYNPDDYNSQADYYDCAGNVIVTYNCQYDMDGEVISASFVPGDNNSSVSVLLFGSVNLDDLITALNTGRGLQSRRIPEKLLLLSDGHFELYMTETVSLPVPATSSSAFLVSVQTKYTGSILESDDSFYYRLRFEKREFIGLRATSYEELYDHYNGINDDSVFFDEFGEKFAGCKDEAEFEGLMREYLEMMTGPGDVTDEAMKDIYIFKKEYVKTAVYTIICHIDPPPVAAPITDPIAIDA